MNGVIARAPSLAVQGDTIRAVPLQAEEAALCDLRFQVLNASFFPRESWIGQPRDWPPSNLRPMRYDLEMGEGARVWAECLERAGSSFPQVSVPASWPLVAREPSPRYGPAVLVQPRLGQGGFRLAVTEAYGSACAVTGEHSLPALDAAHIRPFSREGPHIVANGLLLRADLHRLFDQGYVTVSADHTLEVSKRLRADYQNGRTYYPLHGTSLVNLPRSKSEWPDPELLRWHNESVFLG
jgi:putative restriction endonuclease